MAYTVSRKQTVFGDKRIVIVDITADAATQTVESGLSVIDGFSVGAQSMTTSVRIYANSNASGIASNGVLGISAATSGDKFYVIVFGR